MDKFHINTTTGDAGKCSATQGKCPFGGESNHYTSIEAARGAYETHQAEDITLKAARNDLELYGENSSVFRTWGKVPADFKTSKDGKRSVLANGAGLGTVLTPWHGPKVLEQLKKASIAQAPNIEPTSAMAGWTMTANVLDLEKVTSGERYYDKDGTAYKAARIVKDKDGTLVTMRVLDKDGVPLNYLKEDSFILASQQSNNSSNFYKLVNLQGEGGYLDITPGASTSQAVSKLPQGKGKYESAAIASLSYTDDNGKPETVELLTPVGRLTDKKRIQLGRELWAFTGKDMKRYDEVTDKDRLKWANERIMRRKNFAWANDGNSISYTHESGSGVKDAAQFKLVNLGD